MPALKSPPLGQPIPNRPHAVSCSLPTMRDVCGYEEKDAATVAQLSSGYPRFVVHPFARELAADLEQEAALEGRKLWLVSSARMAEQLVAHLGGGSADARTFTHDGLHGASHPESAVLANRAKTFLQHVGGFISSREAEDQLVRRGRIAAAAPETLFAGDAAAEIRRQLLRVLPRAEERDVLLATSGMNAIYAAFRAVAGLQATRGRTLWLQLGWLYLDTIEILKKFRAGAGDYVYVRDVFDRDGLERIFARHGDRIAGVVAEVPTNPLIQTPDVAWLAGLCRRHEARLLVDPTISSIFNLDVLPHADVVTSSLTKYAASEGDVLAGFAAINPARPDAAELRKRIAAELEPVYSRDLARLAAQIGRVDVVLAEIHASTAKVAAFLERHPAVKEVFWALHPASRDNYRRFARSPNSTGGMITFTLRAAGGLAKFYDKLRLAKGPSFGMTTTLICPFMYLAHYELVTTAAGLAELAASKLDPDLLRLCVGCEPAEDIIAALAEALG